MLTSKSFWIGRHLPLLSPDNDGGSGSESESKTKAETEAKEEKDDLDTIKDLGDAGKEAIRKERASAKAALDRAKAAEDERDALKAEKDQREADEATATEKAAAEAGRFEELAAKRETERDAAKQEAASLKAENDQLKAAMADGLTARVKDLPEHVRKVLDDTVAADDVLARWQWLHKPSVQDLIKSTSGGADVSRANGGLPKSSAAAATRSVEDEAKVLNQSGTYAM